MLPKAVFGALSRKRYCSTTLVVVNGIFCAAIFYFDTLTPGEMPVSTLYSIVIIISGYQDYPYAILFWFSISCVLSMIEYWLSPQTIPGYIGVYNEIIAILAISCIAIITYYQRQGRHALMASRRIAEQANAAKTRFLAAASHDLRQPLQAQILFLAILAERNRDPQMEPILNQMRQAIQAQQEMLATLLDISRLEAGIVKVVKCDFSVRALLDHLTDEFTIQAEQKGLKLRVVACTAIVHSDPTLLERILRNLLTNAIQYTVHGRIILGCRHTQRDLKLQVWDTGVGIPADQLTAIFEEFHQLDNPARDRSKGLGLGLAIVARLVTLLGHQITVRSVVGKGSVFEIAEVPLTRSPPPQQRQDRTPATPAGSNLMPRGSWPRTSKRRWPPSAPAGRRRSNRKPPR